MAKYRIDKSLLDPADRATYEALIAKASVEIEDEEMEEELPFPPKKAKKGAEEAPMVKSADPELTAALERVATLEKSLAMKDCTEVAKKYATAIGEKEDDLAQTLYDMKALGEEPYNKYVAALEKSLTMVENTGLFTEIGKSTPGTAGGVLDKIEAAADEIQKADPNASRTEAIAKAWDNHPELVAEYDAEYSKR